MSESQTPKPGSITWHDLTVENAEQVRAFYEQVVGWTSESVSMGDYDDHSMLLPDGSCVAGVCHARGVNAGLPAQWLMYVSVENVDLSAAKCIELGGEVLLPRRPLAGGRMCVIRDPAGAVCALFEPPESEPAS